MKTVYTYPHTHWDFEWYFSYNESTIQLIYHMDDVIRELKSGKLNSYVLDGQLSILEDYLKYAPENEADIRSLINEKKLIIGPWYTQTDELIISGESIVRNLYYGIKSAKKFGEPMRIGYLPDSFGQSQDMPKILNGCNIKKSIFWRGVAQHQTKGREFRWVSEDDSEVLVYNIKNGYFYGGEAMMVSDDVDTVEKTINKSSTEDLILFPIGSDQRKVDLNYKERLEYYNKETKNDFIYKDSTPEEFFSELDKIKERLDVVKGEFISASDSKIHHSIYSSRYDHKYLNDKIERRIINILEPLMVMAQNIGVIPKLSMLEEIWKIFVRNHAHDSACGCNTDKTNKIILSRLEEVDQLSYSAMDYILRKLSISMNNSNINDIFIFNTLPINKTGIIPIKVSTKSKEFNIYNSDGDRVYYELIECDRVYGGTINKYEKDNIEEEYYYVAKLMVDVDINSLSIIKLTVKEEESRENTLVVKEIVNNDFNIEDNYYRVEYVNGKLNLKDKGRDVLIEDFITIENSGDDGDTYDYSPPEFDRVYRYNFSNSKVTVSSGDLFKELTLSGEWILPRDLEERKEGICSQITPYEFKISLINNEIVNCNLELDNKSNDHRLRAIISSDIVSDKSISNTQFGTVERDNMPIHMDDWREIGWKEEPTPIYPMINYAGLKNDNNAFILMTKGIKEYEIVNNNSVALTLFRSVGYLGKPDLIRRPGSASGNQFKYIETPDSQLKRKLKFKFAIYRSEKFNAVNTYNKWMEYAIWTPFYHMENLNQFTNTLKYFKVNELPDKVEVNEFIDLSKVKSLIVTSVIPVDSNSYTVRFVNPTMSKIDGEEIIIKNSSSIEFVNLTIEDKVNVEVNNGVINLGLFKPGEIKTVRVKVS